MLDDKVAGGSRVEFHVLGSLEVVHDGSQLDLGPHKQRSLLALLLIHANRVVSTDRILDELWGDDSDGKENALWVYVSRLRSVLEPDRVERGESNVLLTRDHGYVLSVGSDAVDAQRFEAAAAEGRALLKDDPEGASARLGEALALWRGRALEDFAYEDFAQTEIARLEELRLAALQDRIEADLRRGKSGELIGELEALHQERPLQERPIGQMMLALYRAGRQADALRAFERFRRTIGEELGIEPSPELRRLEEQILLHDSGIQAREPAARRWGRVGAASANPFKGLREFREDDGGDFFGRDRLIADVVRRLDQGDRLIGLVGPSGSGKSSLVKAGLIPALRKGAVSGSDRWLVAQMVPGSHPFAELEAALLRSSLDAPDSLGDQLSDPEMGLLRAALRLLPGDGSRLLLVIDQLEELFTLVEGADERERFLSSLLPALDDPHGRVLVVLTLRADFYERPLAYPDFGSRLGDGVVNVVPMTPDELEEAAHMPAERAGVSFEPALLAALLTDVVGQSGALPAFQYALTELFDRRVGNALTLETFRAMDGVRGALTRRADDLYAGLEPDQKAAAQQLFLRLVTITDGDEWGRRRVPAGEIISLDVDVVALQAVIETYTQHRLLTLDRDAVTGSPTIEVAHEALLTQWDRLRAWIEESREDVRRHGALTAAMNEWEDAGRDPDYLLAGTRLAGYEQWATTAVMGLTSDERAYFDASIEIREQAIRAEGERIAQEARTKRSARRRLWGLAAAIVALAAVGVWLLLAALAPDPIRIAAVGIERGQSSIADQIVNGIEQAERDFGFEVQTLVPRSDPGAEVERLLESGPDLVITDPVALEFLSFDPTQLAVRHDEVHFAFLQQSDIKLPNVTSANFLAEEGSFLAGAAAALNSDTGIVGFVGALPLEIDAFRAGFEAGARHVRPDIEILSRYLVGRGKDTFSDPALSEEAARALYAQGADVIYHAAGDGGRGIFTAAAELSDESTHLVGIGVDVDEYFLVEEPVRAHVLTSIVKFHDSAVEVIVESFLAGTLEPGEIDMGLANGGLDYSTSGEFLDASTVSVLEDLKQRIISGEISVPDHPGGPATSPVAADVEAMLTFDGERCVLSGLGIAPSLGQVLRLEVVNSSRDEAFFGVFRFRDGTTMDDLVTGNAFAFSEPPGYRNAALAGAGESHAFAVIFDPPGTWGISCFDGVNAFYEPLLTIPES